MSDDTVQLIKDKLDIADFIKGYVPLSPAGKNLKGLCPFHKEKTPSFMVTPDREMWHCFGCGAGGDIFAFLMKYENLEFIEALKVLAERAGVELRRTGNADQKQYAILYDIQTAAKEVFRRVLHEENPRANAAREYLKQRGLTDATIAEFEIGLAPVGSDTLSRELGRAGYAMRDVGRAGLILKTERGTYWDRFRNRIMFPLYNQFGKVIGFTGRILPGDETEGVGKYVNSPETPIFNKSKLLFGLHKAKSAIRESRTALLVEGQMDFLMAWQDGVKNVIATSGTALTNAHLEQLRKMADTLIAGFDNDNAGQLALEHTIENASALDFSIKMLGAPKTGSWKDPADLVKESPGALLKLVAEARPAMYYFLERYGGGKDIHEQKRNLRVVLQKIKMISSAIERAHWIRELARVSGMREQALLDEMTSLRSDTKSSSAVSKNNEAQLVVDARPRSRYGRIAERLLSLGIAEPTFLPRLAEYRTYFPEPYDRVCDACVRGISGKAEYAKDEELSAMLDAIHLHSNITAEGIDAREDEFKQLLHELKAAYYKIKREEAAGRVRQAQADGDEARLTEALMEFDSIAKGIQNG